MLSFLKPKREFGELVNKERFEKILEKYIAPKLSELGFVWTKERAFSEEEIEIVKSLSTSVKSPEKLFIGDSFERERGKMLDTIVIKRNGHAGRLLFSAEWSIDYLPYEAWHLKNFDEEPNAFSVYSWFDGDDKRISSKYRKEHRGITEYDLSRYTTSNVMEHFLEQTLRIRLPDLEKYNTIQDLITLLESRNEPYAYEMMFDFYMMNNEVDKAGRTLKWAEDNLKHEYPDWDEDEDVIKRIDLLKKTLNK